MKEEFDWQVVVDRKPQGYVQLNDGETIVHGPIESVTIDDLDFVVITTKWQAKAPVNAIGIPTGEWVAIGNEPIMLPNLVVPFVIETTPEKGDRARFGLSILYFEAVEGLDPSRVKGLQLHAHGEAITE